MLEIANHSRGDEQANLHHDVIRHARQARGEGKKACCLFCAIQTGRHIERSPCLGLVCCPIWAGSRCIAYCLSCSQEQEAMERQEQAARWAGYLPQEQRAAFLQAAY